MVCMNAIMHRVFHDTHTFCRNFFAIDFNDMLNRSAFPETLLQAIHSIMLARKYGGGSFASFYTNGGKIHHS